MRTKLSIAVITMNRSGQLAEALKSCMVCDLPENTQFVIIDNASTDDTEEIVARLFSDGTWDYYYEKMSENMGAGIGRNLAFAKCKGEYVYFMDDDAFIDVSNGQTFFTQAIHILDTHPDIMTLTTQIYDLAWKKNRVTGNGPIVDGSLRKCYMVCGGSHFLRRAFFKGREPYFANKYGYEELRPSLLVYDSEKVNAFVPDLNVIHNPKINKWDYSQEKNHSILIDTVVNQMAIKGCIYPVIAYPVVYAAYKIRCRKYLDKRLWEEANRRVAEMKRQYDFGERIKFSTLIKLYLDFGFSIF